MPALGSQNHEIRERHLAEEAGRPAAEEGLWASGADVGVRGAPASYRLGAWTRLTADPSLIGGLGSDPIFLLSAWTIDSAPPPRECALVLETNRGSVLEKFIAGVDHTIRGQQLIANV